MNTQHHQKKKTYTQQRRQNEARPRLCYKCGVPVPGWDNTRHNKVCRAVNDAQHLRATGCATLFSTPTEAVTGNEFLLMETEDGSTGYERDESEEESTSIAFQDEDNKRNTNAIATEVSAYLSSLTTLDPAHIGECLHWGPTYQSTTSELTRVVAKFLRVTMLGDGLSRAHMQAILEFTHDMGGKKAALLPKKVKGCWRALTKVFA